MSATAKGVAVGAANLFVIAVLLGLAQNERRIPGLGDPLATFMTVMLMGSLMAVLGGAALGWLAGRLTRFRGAILVTLTLAMVVAIGLLTVRSWIGYAAPPSIVAALGLGWWTRPALGAPPPARLGSIAYGVALALAALVAVGALLGILVHHDYLENHAYPRLDLEGFGAMLVIWIGGLIPTLAVGCIGGALAGKLAHAPVWLRVVALAAPVTLLVVAVGAVAHRTQYVGAALVPIFAATLALEHFTRASSRNPAIPLARLRGE